MADIQASVGKGGANQSADVTLVQQRLNEHMSALGLPGLVVDGDYGENTLNAIRAYQKEVVGLSNPDGRIDPGGRTWQALTGGKTVEPVQAAPGDPASRSGAAWWHANQQNYPNSASLDDLAPGFREKARAFVQALKDAGASVSVSATLRNPSRAHLMHYCWQVAHGAVRPRDVPARPDCNIDWDHGDVARSRAGAQEMVDKFGIAYKPSLTSLHIQGRAVDMTIGWTGTLNIRDANGRMHALGAPRNGADNRGLHAVGATYGMHKLASDPPHWSDNGH